ncbi:MAG: CdaR family protein [Candidatus Kapaibacteriota bacterium]
MKLKRIFARDNLKGLIFALVVSFTIWIYAVLNSEYNIYIKVPLNIIPPEKHSISGKIPENIDVLVSAIGWQILNLAVLPKSASCTISLDQIERFNDKVILTKNDLIKGTFLGVNAKILDVSPSSLSFEIGKMVEKVVPVEPKITIRTRDNFVVVGSPIVKPQYVTISGRKEVLDLIDHWETIYVTLEDVHKPMQIEVPLSDTLRSQVKLNTNKVMIYIDVDLSAERTIYDIPIIVDGGFLPEDHVIFPKQVNAVVRTGVNKLIEIDPITLTVKVDYSEIMKDTIGIIVPRIDVPNGLSIVSIDPPYLYHWKVSKVK